MLMCRVEYAFPCAGCICNHCANSVETIDNCTGEAKESCFICDECKWYDGDIHRESKWKQQCRNFIVTEEHVKRLRKKIRMVKQ